MAVSKNIVNTIFKGINFSQDETMLIASKFEIKKFPKGHLLIKPNEVVETLYYIMKGCVRTFCADSNGKEHTLQIGIADWWISDYTAFFNSNKATMTVEVIQDSILYKISRSDQEFLFNKIPKFEHYYRVKLEGAFAAFQKRILGELAESAKQRYLNFVEKYPNIERKVKNYHIASYLGITTESLSRIRKELANT